MGINRIRPYRSSRRSSGQQRCNIQAVNISTTDSSCSEYAICRADSSFRPVSAGLWQWMPQDKIRLFTENLHFALRWLWKQKSV